MTNIRSAFGFLLLIALVVVGALVSLHYGRWECGRYVVGPYVSPCDVWHWIFG